jgi:hypothetical protein
MSGEKGGTEYVVNSVRKDTYFLGLLTAFRIDIMTFCNIHNKITLDCSIGATILYAKEDQRLV